MQSKIIVFVFLLFGFLHASSHPGIGIVEDSKGNIFYTDLKKVWKIGTDGTKKVVVNNVHTHELYLDKNDNLFGEHLWYESEKNTWRFYVWRLSADGKIEKVIPDSEGFLSNYSFVRDHHGKMYWANRDKSCQKVSQKNASNTVSLLTDQCFKNIRWMKSTPGGTVYVVDFQDLKKIDPSGRVTTVAKQMADKKVTESTIENQNSVGGVWDDPSGNLYAAIISNREVKKFSLDGKEETILKTTFSWMPSGGLVDSKGNLWVLECSVTNAVRVEKIEKSGRRTAF
ncbi:MAG TPA: hypothetical protein PLR06_03745 [Cyclobacteriaceae bacterium]|nr:hypothetical protein [Cyclobacteriaceae bacterium]